MALSEENQRYINLYGKIYLNIYVYILNNKILIINGKREKMWENDMKTNYSLISRCFAMRHDLHRYFTKKKRSLKVLIFYCIDFS